MANLTCMSALISTICRVSIKIVPLPQFLEEKHITHLAVKNYTCRLMKKRKKDKNTDKAAVLSKAKTAAKNVKELGTELGKAAAISGADFGKIASIRAVELAKVAAEKAQKLRKRGLTAIRKLTSSPEVNLALLAELATLRERGVITEKEFQSKKKEILDRV